MQTTPLALALVAFALISALAAPRAVHAQQRADVVVTDLRQLPPDLVPAPGDICTLRSVSAAGPVRRAARLRVPEAGAAQRTATFVIDFLGPADGENYVDFPQEAREALQRAADLWATHIDTAVDIHVAAAFEPLDDEDADENDGRALAQAGPRFVYSATVDGQRSVYGGPLIESLIGSNQNDDPDEADIVMSFNSNRDDWYYGTGSPAQNEIDFTTVAVHELGHGLGFFGSMEVTDDGEGEGTWGYTFDSENPLLPAIYDRFAEDGEDNRLIDQEVYPRPSDELAAALEGQRGGVVFDGEQARMAFEDGSPPALYAPEEWNEGSSYSHFDEDTYPTDDRNALMTPFVAFQEVAESPGPATCGVMADLGWVLGADCEALLDREPLEFEGEVLAEAYPNPFTDATGLRVRLAARDAQQAVVALYNTLGQRVRVVPAGRLVSQSERVVTIPAGGLPSGVYFVQVVGERFTETIKVVLVR